jgi:aminoglycoside phosphotransferase family enzyme/predicted kinase
MTTHPRAEPPTASIDVLTFLAGDPVFGDGPRQRIDTHAAHVFLAGDRAWKLKRPVRYGYLNFSSPELRGAALNRELELNRRTAPQLYLAVHRITDESGSLRLDGDGDTVDWLLEMRRFADEALLANVAARGALTPALLQQVADAIVDFHTAAPPAQVGGANQLRTVLEGNVKSLAAYPALLDREVVDELVSAQRLALERHAELLDARARNGRVVRGHGDLHLANIALVDDTPVLFDCLEFSDDLATVDMLYDVAFLVMDLWKAGCEDAANLVANRYCDRSAVDEDGWPLFPLFVSLRATVRAHVRAAAGAADDAQRYLQLARDVLGSCGPRLIAVGGRSGTGKTSLARTLAAPLGSPPGARVLRSDILRKRLAGVAPEVRLSPDSYTREASETVYAATLTLTEQHLCAGDTVIVDAAFLRQDERRDVAALAERVSAPFTGLWLTAEESARMRRVASRTGDASDATPEVAGKQAEQPIDSSQPWTIVDAGRSVGEVAAHARAVMGRG